jgi:hypothetical protein
MSELQCIIKYVQTEPVPGYLQVVSHEALEMTKGLPTVTTVEPQFSTRKGHV